MGSASSQLKPTQPVTPSQKQALTAEALPENELETQPRLGEDFCPVQSALREGNTALSRPARSDSTNAFLRDKYQVDAVAEQADMAKKKKDQRSSSRPATPVDVPAQAGDQDVSMTLDEPSTQLRREMLLSQQQHDARAAEDGEDRQDESPAKKKKERKKKKKSMEGTDAPMEQAEGPEPKSVQAAEVAQPAAQSKKRKRKSKAEKDAEKEAEPEADTIRVAASSGWQAVNVNGNGSANNEDSNENDNNETEQPPAKKRKRTSKAATKEVDSTTADPGTEQAPAKKRKRKSRAKAATKNADSTTADPGTLLVNAAEDDVPIERPKSWRRKPKDDTEGPSPLGAGFSGLPKSGAFTPIETELIATTIDGFREVNSLTEHAFNALVQEGVKKSVELRDLLNDILETLPNRNSQAIRRFLERRYHNCQRGPWSAHEDGELRLAFADHPNEWKKIAGRLNRMAEDCRDRWRNHAQYSQDQRNKDIWTPEEEQELLDAIETCISRMQESGALPADVDSTQIPEETIQWKVVSEIMDGKRNRLQCSYKWKKLKYRAWRKQQEANGTLPARRKPQKTSKKWRSADKVTAEDDEDGEEGDPEVDEAPIEEDGQDDVEGDAIQGYVIEPEQEEHEYRADNLDGIAREPEESIERHTLWHHRYDVGDWYSMLREMFEIYNDFKSTAQPHHQYWDVLHMSFDHGNWGNDDRMRSLDRCCRGLRIPKSGLGNELNMSLLILETRSSTRDLERTVMGRRPWPYLTSGKQYRTPSASDHSGTPRTLTPVVTAINPELEEPVVESEPMESAVDSEPIDVEDDLPEDAPPAATLDENDPTFWDPVSPPTQAPQLTVSKKTPRTERAEPVEAGPSKSSSIKKTPRAEPAEPGPSKFSSTKKRASYGKMSKHKWTPAKSFYEDENDPIEDSQVDAIANAEAVAAVEAGAENDVNHSTVDVVDSAPQDVNDVAAEHSEGETTAEVEGAAVENVDTANAAQSREEQPLNLRSFRPVALRSQETADDLRPFDEASLDAPGADEAAPAGHYVIYEPAFDRHSTDEKDEESQDSSNLDVMAVDGEATVRQPQNVEAVAPEDHLGEAAQEETETGPIADASDDEEEMREWRLRDLTAERDAAGVEGAIAVATPNEDETMEDAMDGDHGKDTAVAVSDDGDNDSDDDREEVIRVAPKLEAEEAELDTHNSDEENDAATAAVNVQEDQDNSTEDEDEEDEQKPAQSHAVMMAEPELGSPFRSQSPESVVLDTQARSISSSRTSSVVSSDSEEELAVVGSDSEEEAAVVGSDSEEEPAVVSSDSEQEPAVVSSDSEDGLEVGNTQSSSSSRTSSVVSSDSEEEEEAVNTRPLTSSSSSSSSRSSSVVSSDSEHSVIEAKQQQRNNPSDQMSTQSEDEVPKSSIVPVTQTQTKTQSSQNPTQSGKKSKAIGRVNRAVVKQESESVPESGSDEEPAMTKKARRLANMRRKRRDEDLDLGSVDGRD